MRTGFSTRIIQVYTSDGHTFKVGESFSYTTKAGEEIIVPRGANTDGLSIPRGLWNALPPFGGYWLAGVVHDYLYRGTGKPKDYCDDVFLEAMEVLGVDLATRTTIYEGVHLGGWKAFREDRQ